MDAMNKAHLRRIAEMGCIVCLREGLGKSPAEVHHIRAGQGMGQRADDTEAIPLCPLHHRLGGHGVAFHAGPRAFERRFGTERELLDDVRRRLRHVDEADEGEF